MQSISSQLPFRLPPFYTLIVRTLTILEGLALYVDKDFKLVKGAYPFIAKQLLTSPSPELKELLQSVILTPKGRIRWDRLEQFISIAGSADKAMAGDFSALKSAQERSDIVKAFRGQQQTSNFTLEVSLSILEFLISEDGSFLREPLIDEIVETMDALSLTSARIVSLSTNGLFPSPNELPDKERVEQFINLVRIFLARSSSNQPSSSYPNLISGINRLQQFLLSATSPTSQRYISKLSSLANQVMARLLEKSARRVLRSCLSPARIESGLPVVSRAIDLAIPLLPRNSR